nr:MAG TPA: phosphocarrier protein HPr [Caudoviricetes sp.]
MIENFRVKLTTPRDVIDFSAAASSLPLGTEITAAHGNFIVDAKSIMGLYSLNLSEPIAVEIKSDDVDTYIKNFNNWIVRDEICE